MNRSVNPTKLILSALLFVVAAEARADFTVIGRYEYVDRPFSFSGGFSSTETTEPVRLATVQVIDDSNGAVLATSFTNQSGSISIPVTGSGTKDIVVRCFSRSNQFGANNLRVVTTGNVQYSVSSAVFNNWDQGTDLNIGIVVAQKVFSGSDQGGPFNILDQLVAGVEYIKSLGASNPTGSIRANWPGGSGSFASGFTFWASDDDGFDDMVQLHELGHVIHNMYSESDNTGGSHGFGQSDQDPRLSYAEGWASFFGGAVRQFQGIDDPGFYMDCNGDGQTGAGGIQLRMDFESGSPFTGSTGGEADEGAVFCALWELVDTVSTPDGNSTDDDPFDGSITFNGGLTGDQQQWAVFTGPIDQAANCTIRDQWDGSFAPTNHGRHTELEAMFDDWEMRFYNDAAEPNNATGTAAPLTLGNSWGAIRTLYSSAANPPAPGEGDQDWYSFELGILDIFEVETRYPNGAGDAETYCDPRLTIFRPDGSQMALNNDGGTGRNAKLTNQVANQTGTWKIRVDTTHSFRKTGSYQVRARILTPAPCGFTNYGTGELGSNGQVASIFATGEPLSGDSIDVQVTGGNPSSFCVLFEGSSLGNNVVPWGTILVAGPGFLRHYTATDAGGNASVVFPVVPALSGTTLYFQYAIRDPGFGGNIQASDGLQVDFCP